MNTKYEFTGATKLWYGVTVRRIRATKSFGVLCAGDVGGWIEKESNLSYAGNAWVSGDAKVSGNAWVSGDALVSGNAQVSGNSWVHGESDFLLLGPIGSRRSFLTVTADSKIGVRYTTGCFSGNRTQLISAVKKTHAKTSLYAKQYAAALAMAKVCVKAPKKVKV